jgi:iron complex outermembrane receptor protein
MKNTRFATSMLFLILLFNTLLHAENTTGSIRGVVYNESMQPLSNVNVVLSNSSYGDITDANGFFEMSTVRPGDYEIRASSIGFLAQTRNITVIAGEELQIQVVLPSVNEELGTITVRASKMNRYANESSNFVAKIDLPDLQNPQVYNSVDSRLLRDQVITRFDDAIKNAPGVAKLWESTGRGGDGSGYYAIRGFATQPTMVNGLPALTNGSLDPAGIERIEFIKGPSGTLFGGALTSYGGLINVVTKTPYESFGGAVAYKTGEFGLNRIEADVNTAVGSNDNMFVRLNTAFSNQNSFQDAGFQRSFYIAPSLLFKSNERLSFLIQSEVLQSETTNQTMLFLNRSNPLVASNLEELNYNPFYSYTSNDLTIKNPTVNFQTQMNYSFANGWTSQTAVSASNAKTDGYYTYMWDLADANKTYLRYLSYQNSQSNAFDVQQNFRSTLQTGSITHKLLVGADYLSRRVINNSTGYVGFGTVSVGGAAPSGVSKAAADQALAASPVTNSTTEQNVLSAYIADVLEFNSRLSVLASLRVDHFTNEGNVANDADNYEQTTLSPKVGVVYQILPSQLSVFANYMNGFRNVAPRTQADGSTANFNPEQANQLEFGLKTNLLEGRVSATASYYSINVSNVVRQDPDRVNFFVQDGENYSRGVEFSLTASPARGLNLIAGYSYNDSKITKTDALVYLNRRPESAGPEHLGNFWATYQLSSGTLNGLGFGFGANYIGENYIMNRSNVGEFVLPSYTIVNASVFYQADNYRLDLKVNNLADTEYYTGWTTLNPQMPRYISGAVSYNF